MEHAIVHIVGRCGVVSALIATMTVCLASFSFSADYYKWVDDKGNIHFADSPAGIPAKYNKRATEEDFAPSTPKSTVTEESVGSDYSLIREKRETNTNHKNSTGKEPLESVPFYSEQTFDQQVLRSNKLAIVEFTADWCPPCRRLAPIIDQLAIEFVGKAKIGKVDSDTEKKLINKYMVKKLPTLLFFKKGKIIKRLVGGMSYKQLQGHIQKTL